MIPGMENSFTGVGNLRNEMNTKLAGKADKYELSSLNSKINSLESTIQQLRSELTSLRQDGRY